MIEALWFWEEIEQEIQLLERAVWCTRQQLDAELWMASVTQKLSQLHKQ